jgi:hypothetical protein
MNRNMKKSSVEARPAFIYLVNQWRRLAPLDRAVGVQSLLSEGYSGRHLAKHFTEAGIKVDESTIRHDGVIARLPESYKQAIRSGEPTTSVLKRAKAAGVLDDLVAASNDSSEPEQQPAKQQPEMPLDHDSYLRTINAGIEGIGAALESQHQRELENRDRNLARQFKAANGTPLNRQERLERLYDIPNRIQEGLDRQRQELEEYQARIRRIRQFGRATDKR